MTCLPHCNEAFKFVMNDKVEMIAAIPSENHGQCTFCYTVTVQSSEEELEKPQKPSVSSLY